MTPGAFDTHIHSAPDVLPRKFNDLELAQRFKARRMAGFVLKSHYICTADRATLVNATVPEVQAFEIGGTSQGINMPDNIDFQPKTNNVVLHEDAETSFESPHNNDIWDCLSDGGDQDHVP